VSVNRIIGMPMIHPSKLSLDLIDNVFKSGILNTKPFPVIYRTTIQFAPDFSKASSDDLKLFASNTEFDHATLNDVKAYVLAMSNDIAAADFAKPIWPINPNSTMLRLRVCTKVIIMIPCPKSQ
jgi:hypothetical protein